MMIMMMMMMNRNLKVGLEKTEKNVLAVMNIKMIMTLFTTSTKSVFWYHIKQG
jgi:hypothetical protein